jgi:hypothetical protein
MAKKDEARGEVLQFCSVFWQKPIKASEKNALWRFEGSTTFSQALRLAAFEPPREQNKIYF